ncbi:DUF4123 domain-containing protein [Agrobacterium tumefaciens]|uniref:DUF4123 domain-containing protein n=1 Tax=Agrobacterium TaxID=357 RepID=UPI00098E8757|nr:MULTISPECIES: DUF4123 domain-containing protein [Agrobacterium]MBS0257981.1 DUF4123 domain-containing protein [Pseudomonadota bacterium]MBW9073784.1 DUF4123 domain-containing protein [Agrobacterium deltaense]MCZ7502704.1 DUF4123 domain-containing protein [Rhizobium rhizogenes]MDA5242836.1 DUF4123 domain-containing protein [Agrobacterium sp. MAFF310724]MDA5247738.1 DUF4123 domain-containing protein [Agrobacterium sp. MAFF210268]
MELNSEKRQEVLSKLREEQGAGGAARLYAVVDASRAPMIIPPALQAMTDKVACLYRGNALEEFGDDTAWVAEMTSDESVLQWLIDNGFGKRWSIFLRTSHALEDVVRHLRKFTMVKDSEGTIHFFRYYDPRTLRQYLPVLTSEQAAVFFNGIECFYCENDLKAGEFLKFRFGNGIVHREIVLPSGGTGQAKAVERALS